MSYRTPLAALLGAALFATGAAAGPENVEFPANYESEFTQYFAGDRTADEKQIMRMFANDTALEAARSGDGELPYGSVLVAEVYAAKLDENGDPIVSSLGRRIVDKLKAVAVMERGKGFDEEYPEELKVGDWEFNIFSPDGKPLDKDINACRECHKPLEAQEFVFSYQHLARQP